MAEVERMASLANNAGELMKASISRLGAVERALLHMAETMNGIANDDALISAVVDKASDNRAGVRCLLSYTAEENAADVMLIADGVVAASDYLRSALESLEGLQTALNA